MVEQALGGSEIEVAEKAARRRFTLDYKRQIVREADGCKTLPTAVWIHEPNPATVMSVDRIVRASCS